MNFFDHYSETAQTEANYCRCVCKCWWLSEQSSYWVACDTQHKFMDAPYNIFLDALSGDLR